MLGMMATRSLYVRTDFVSCGVRGCVLGTTDLSDQNALLECLRSIREADVAVLDCESLRAEVLTNFERTFVESEKEAAEYLLAGDGLIFLDGEPGCVRIAVRNFA